MSNGFAAAAPSDFVAGFAPRHAAAAHALGAAFGGPIGFAPVDPRTPARSGPRHFSPADRAANPTEGWNPLDPEAEPSGFIDPVETARAAGYAEGVAAATAAAQTDALRDRALLTELAAAIGAGGGLDREAVAQRLRETVLFLVTRLVGETGVSADLLAGRVEAAAELLADASESALLRLHPADVALVEGRLPRNLFAAGDAAVARGSFVLESASTVVEDGPALWLEQLAAAIDRVPVPLAAAA